MAERDVTIRLRLKDGQKVGDAMQRLGSVGQAALMRVERASKPASKGLLVLNQSTLLAKDSTVALATNAGGLAGVLTRLGPLGLAVGAGIGAMVLSLRAMSRASRESIESLSTLANTADKLGVTVESLQELRFAAEQNGVATDTLDLAMQRFTRRLAQAQQGGGELKRVLDQYNIAMVDSNGTARTATEVLKDLADATAAAGSDGEQLRIAFTAFDSEGAALVKVLEQGGDAVERYAEQARNLGIVIDNDVVQAVREAGDKLNQLEKQNEAVVARMGARGTSLAIIQEEFRLTVNKLADAVTANIRGIVDDYRDAESITRVEMELERISDRAAEIRVEAVAAKAAFDEFGVAGDRLKLINLEEEADELLRRKEYLEKALAAAKAERAAREASAGKGGAPEPLKIDVVKELSAAQRLINDLSTRIGDLSLGDFGRELSSNMSRASAGGTKPVNDEEREQIFALTAELRAKTKVINDAADAEREARQVSQSLRTAEERRIETLKKLQEFKEKGLLTTEDLSRAEAQAAEERLQESTEFADGITRAMNEMSKAAEDHAAIAEAALKGAFDAAGDSIEDMVKQGKVDLESLGEAVFDLLFELAAAEAQKQIIKPVISFIGSALGLVAADGAVMDHGMPVTPFRKGGVTTGPTFFPMANGQVGLMGEDGEEAIMPLKRTPDGALGVRAVLPDMRGAGGGGVTVVFAPTIRVEVAGGGSGDAAADRKFGEQISEQITGALLEMVDERIVDQMRVGGIINPMGDRRFGG